jgi:lysophospholipase L1-like esterase
LSSPKSAARLRVRRVARTLVVIIPILLVTQLLWIFFDVVRLRFVDSEELLASFSEHLAIRDARPLPQFGVSSAGEEEVGPTIWVLGASSIFFPQGETFVEQLGERLRKRNPQLQTVNLGISGIESRALVEHFEANLANRAGAPGLLIIYAGHNDYNVLYHASVARKFDLFEPLFYLLAPFTRPGLNHGMTVYLRSRVPPLVEWLQSRGLVDFSQLSLVEVNRLIAARFKGHMTRIVKQCKAQGIAVMFVTPVGNLLARPYGSLAATSIPYLRGLSLPAGEGRLSHLRAAQESEFLTFDIRAKAGVREVMWSLEEPGVVVLDLDGWLVAQELRLDSRLFSDYFHFTKWGHARVTEFLVKALAERPEVEKKLGLTESSTAESR